MGNNIEYIKAHNIVNRNKPNSWFRYEYSMNIYRGCNHSCIYCDSRCSCYRVKNFDQVQAKENALEIIRDDLRRKVKRGVICSGAMSDPYNIFEKELELTRHSLELINAYDFGIGLITKSDLIIRDIDILSEIQEHSPVMAKLTITTADDSHCKLLEPNAPSASRRFEALRQLSEANIFSGIILMPVLPFIEDTEENIVNIVEAAYKNGAKFIFPRMGVTLRGNQKEWFFDELDKSFPGIKEKYIQEYGNKIYCNSKNTRKLMKLLREKCNQYGILYDMDSIIRRSRQGFEFSQFSLF